MPMTVSEAVLEPRAAGRRAHPRPTPVPALPASRILIAEGHPLTASLIEAALRRRGRDVVVVHDGREALRSVESLEPALLVCDLVLPDMSGFELLAQVGELGRGAGVRRLVLSSLPSAVELEARRVGADAFLTKPFDPAVLAELVDVLLERQSTPEPER